MADATIPTRKPISTLDIAWAAGFLEGEGSFTYHGSAVVTAAQVQKEPIDRLVTLFGGRMWLRQTRGFSLKPIWVWQPPSRRAVEIMLTVYTLMSPKRQSEIEFAVKRWSQGRMLKSHSSDTCGIGHPLVGSNIKWVGKYRKCRYCLNYNKRRRRAAGSSN
jgi:hypothetical protein